MQQNPHTLANPAATPSVADTEPDLEAAPARPPWRRCLHWLADVLARAETRVTENFRVPPGGG